MARRSLNEHRRSSLPFEEGHSAATLVDEQSMDSVKLPGSIPFIDFSKMKPTVKSSGAKLRISVVPQSRPSSSRSRSSSSCVIAYSIASYIVKFPTAPLCSMLMHAGSLEFLDFKFETPSDISRWTRLLSSSTTTGTLARPSAAASSRS